MNILMVAAENDALIGGKVGGIGDVVRDIPVALAALGHKVNVVTPGYGLFSLAKGSKSHGFLEVNFAGVNQRVELFKVQAKKNCKAKNVTLWALEHPLFACGGKGEIYCNDPSDRPFASDANKFALFSIAVAQATIEGKFGKVEQLHLHDWHASIVALLRHFDPSYKKLRLIHTVYTIHNLALQGIRPFSGDESALDTWFPNLSYETSSIYDPRVQHCLNPMRVGINLSDKVHAVSPTYAKEILKPSKPEQGFFGGEGLEQDLIVANKEGRLHGILNGCEYPVIDDSKKGLQEFLSICEVELIKWIGKKPQVDSAHFIADKRIPGIKSSIIDRAATNKKSLFIATSIGRITDQKALILQQTSSNGISCLDRLLDILKGQGLLIMLGSGDSRLEQFLTESAAEHDNFLFLKGYSEDLPDYIYQLGDLFLMPSSFEPCGISQMLSMRAGQPCLVHQVGGLKDTVFDKKNGFTFSGDSLQQQADNMVTRFKAAMQTKQKSIKQWNKICDNADNERFLWNDAAKQYVDYLYSK